MNTEPVHLILGSTQSVSGFATRWAGSCILHKSSRLEQSAKSAILPTSLDRPLIANSADGMAVKRRKKANTKAVGRFGGGALFHSGCPPT